ncbi:amino acid ABC transporter permease [Geobacter sulfurreducens]|uniref:Putative glutamine transport system permease protein GlnP n=1 Tax=Geobacter sulfurreducens (strain ATCC 51573 / DSM 12127 / PCA) TaxID=243231 RepID=Q746W3_GEOSL|nr:amino acid ABC transporter permease [Geobacter sulfurreducens]AAR36795.1 amino acid ABC transporter, membrane protein [Geobacter sulfurreducens PCA]ADI86162.1 amino acid ABC transporter, membrane protein [Geobacter sulfurreducens KN400]AJY69659.1 amino acid ABC transporter permease [Geobacter sulfurreducens]QVW35215.1 amino acid ABC transporter permease [Geobacter sulfurreducens]UAC04052.1 amino acid ABC transporter permease [Geobacter sulfurreducens]
MVDQDRVRPAVVEVGDGAAIPSKSDIGLFTAWRIAFVGAIGILVVLTITKPDPYLNILKFVPDGILVTFQVTVGAILLALVIGLVAGLGRISSNRIINGIASLYVEIIRGIPLLVQLFYIYYALGRFVHVPDMASAIIAMAVCYGAYMGEVIRAGIQSIPKGQMEAARSLGMTKGQAMRHVILPQAAKVVLPPIGNEFIALLKDSSLVSILAVADILRRGREFASESFTYFETYTVIALVYLIITLFLSKLIGIMEERISAGS